MKPNERILLLDDEPLPRMMASLVLKGAGAVVSEAATCEEALRLSRGTVFDAAVLDHRLPDGFGIDLVHTLRGEGATFPVVILSGEAADIACEPADGICAVLEKPLEADSLLAALAEAGGQGKPAAGNVGSFLLWNPHAEAPAAPVDRLAIDFSQWEGGVPLPEPVAELAGQPRPATAVVGAPEPMRAALAALGGAIDFVEDVDELAALSRRPTSPSERNALLGS